MEEQEEEEEEASEIFLLLPVGVAPAPAVRVCVRIRFCDKRLRSFSGVQCLRAHCGMYPHQRPARVGMRIRFGGQGCALALCALMLMCSFALSSSSSSECSTFRLGPTMQTAQQNTQIPQVQFLGTVGYAPVVQRLVPMVPHSADFRSGSADAAHRQDRRHPCCGAEFLLVLTFQKTIETPLFQYIVMVVDVLVVQGPAVLRDS